MSGTVIKGLVTDVKVRAERIARITLCDRRRSIDVVGRWPWNPLVLHPHSTSLRIVVTVGKHRCLTLRKVLHCSTPAARLRTISGALDRRRPSAQLAEAVDRAAARDEPCFAWTWESRLRSARWQELLPQVRDRPWSFWADYGSHRLACLDFSTCRALSAADDPALEAACHIQRLERRCAQLKSTALVGGELPGGELPGDLRCGVRAAGGRLYPERRYQLERRVEARCRALGSRLTVTTAAPAAGDAWVVAPTVPTARHHRCHTLPLAAAALRGRPAVVVREAHLLGLEQAAALLDLLADGERPLAELVLAGDPHQLPPLGTGSLFRNLLGCTATPVFVPTCPATLVTDRSLESWVRQHWRREDELLVCSSARWCTLFNGSQPPRPGDRVVCVRNVPGLADGSVGTLRPGPALERRDGSVHPLPDLAAVQCGWAVTVRRIQGADLSEWPRLVLASCDMGRRTLRTAVLGASQRCRVVSQSEWSELADGDTVSGENGSWVARRSAEPPPPPPPGAR